MCQFLDAMQNCKSNCRKYYFQCTGELESLQKCVPIYRIHRCGHNLVRMGVTHRLNVHNSCAKLFQYPSMNKRFTVRTQMCTYVQDLVTLKNLSVTLTF